MGSLAGTWISKYTRKGSSKSFCTFIFSLQAVKVGGVAIDCG